jgi:hypothetical protein
VSEMSVLDNFGNADFITKGKNFLNGVDELAEPAMNAYQKLKPFIDPMIKKFTNQPIINNQNVIDDSSNYEESQQPKISQADLELDKKNEAFDRYARDIPVIKVLKQKIDSLTNELLVRLETAYKNEQQGNSPEIVARVDNMEDKINQMYNLLFQAQQQSIVQEQPITEIIDHFVEGNKMVNLVQEQPITEINSEEINIPDMSDMPDISNIPDMSDIQTVEIPPPQIVTPPINVKKKHKKKGK